MNVTPGQTTGIKKVARYEWANSAKLSARNQHGKRCDSAFVGTKQQGYYLLMGGEWKGSPCTKPEDEIATLKHHFRRGQQIHQISIGTFTTVTRQLDNSTRQAKRKHTDCSTSSKRKAR